MCTQIPVSIELVGLVAPGRTAIPVIMLRSQTVICFRSRRVAGYALGSPPHVGAAGTDVCAYPVVPEARGSVATAARINAKANDMRVIG
jgi:hypothetical protein